MTGFDKRRQGTTRNDKERQPTQHSSGHLNTATRPSEAGEVGEEGEEGEVGEDGEECADPTKNY